MTNEPNFTDDKIIITEDNVVYLLDPANGSKTTFYDKYTDFLIETLKTTFYDKYTDFLIETLKTRDLEFNNLKINQDLNVNGCCITNSTETIVSTELNCDSISKDLIEHVLEENKSIKLGLKELEEKLNNFKSKLIDSIDE